MLFDEVTGTHLARLRTEADIPNRAFYKKMLARTKTENPLFAVLVCVAADCARAKYVVDGNITPDGLHDLVIDVGMLCLRALELAAIDGEGNAEKRMDAKIEAELLLKMLTKKCK